MDFKLSYSLKSLNRSLVRPIAECGSILWDSYTSSDSYQFERVQRKFLNFASFSLKIEQKLHGYSPISRHLKLSSLSDRRVFVNLNVLNKIASGPTDAPELFAEVPLHHTNYGSNHHIHRMTRLVNENLCSITFLLL